VTRRLPQIAFVLLALATIGAFFLVQALKTQSPLLWAAPHPVPAAINPIDGHPCQSLPFKGHPDGVSINYRQTQITISLSHADTVGIYVVSAGNPAGNTVATLSSGTPMRASPTQGKYQKTFTWNGRFEDGQPAPAGKYYFRIVLEHEGRSANINQYPVQVITQSPRVRILSVRMLEPRAGNGTTTTTTATTRTTTTTGTATTGKQGTGLVAVKGPAVISPPHGNGVRITYTPGHYRRVSIDIYRTDVAGSPELVDPLVVNNLTRNWTTWNGKIDGESAPAGTYLIGIAAQDLACDGAQWPKTIPPASGTTANAGVTVRYLSVTPPLTPTVSGAQARVSVDSAGVGFSWRLRRSGSRNVLAQGSGRAGSTVIRVPMPRHGAGLYTLAVRAGAQSAAVPLVASRAGAVAAHARVLVVLPMLTWMGNSPVDDSGDGVPDTLRGHSAASLNRPLVDGPPAGFGADVTLLRYLSSHDLSYQLTTDVALAEGQGPSLADRGGVVFAEGEDFLPAGLELTLRGFARAGGRVLVLGVRALSATSHIAGFPAAPRALAPRSMATDPFGARRGQLTPTGGELISSVSSDAFGLFHDAGEFGGFSQYQPIRPPADVAAGTVSAVGIGSAAPAIVAFHYGGGSVVEVGLSGFAASLAHNPDSASLLNNVWQLLAQ
jgi:hypothetical protein